MGLILQYSHNIYIHRIFRRMYFRHSDNPYYYINNIIMVNTKVKIVKKLPRNFYLLFNDYTDKTIEEWVKKKVCFGDKVLYKYISVYSQDNIKKFRSRVNRLHKKESFEEAAKVLVTESIRPLLLDIIDDITKFLKPMGDLVLSGGEAVNFYLQAEDKVITSDIDTKFVPKMKADDKYFGKLQAVKLLLWNKLGEIAQRDNYKIIDTVLKETNQYFTNKDINNYNLNNASNVLIDVELFTLDMKFRLFNIKTGKNEDMNFGGILDIAFMRPKQLGYDVAKTNTFSTEMNYQNMNRGKIYTVKYKYLTIPTKSYLIKDIFMMQKMGLRMGKVEKDRKRMIALGRLMSKKRILSTDSIDTIAKKVGIKLGKPAHTFRTYTKVGPSVMKKASEVKPKKYQLSTTTPS